MPELPVEFCVRRLNDWLLGELITGVVADGGAPLRRTAAQLVGHSSPRLSNREAGKADALAPRGAGYLLVHLGMTGKWVRLSDQVKERRWVRLRLTLVRAMLFYHPRNWDELNGCPPIKSRNMPRGWSW